MSNKQSRGSKIATSPGVIGRYGKRKVKYSCGYCIGGQLGSVKSSKFYRFMLRPSKEARPRLVVMPLCSYCKKHVERSGVRYEEVGHEVYQTFLADAVMMS